jgi:hypothetical protein
MAFYFLLSPGPKSLVTACKILSSFYFLLLPEPKSLVTACKILSSFYFLLSPGPKSLVTACKILSSYYIHRHLLHLSDFHISIFFSVHMYSKLGRNGTWWFSALFVNLFHLEIEYGCFDNYIFWLAQIKKEEPHMWWNCCMVY